MTNLPPMEVSWVEFNRVVAELSARITELETQLVAHTADKSAYVHSITPQEHEAAIVNKIDARLFKITNPAKLKHLLVGQHPPQAYLMPGATGDPHTDSANYEWAIWNAYQRRKWEAEHDVKLCQRCDQDPNHHKDWCDKKGKS